VYECERRTSGMNAEGKVAPPISKVPLIQYYLPNGVVGSDCDKLSVYFGNLNTVAVCILQK